MKTKNTLIISLALLTLSSCSSAPTRRQLFEDCAVRMLKTDTDAMGALILCKEIYKIDTTKPTKE